jgi:diaminopimelate decarboxylase
MHIGSQITEAAPFADAIRKLVSLVRDLKERYDLEFFSIGGGMGIVYRRALESGTGKWWHDHGGEQSAFSVRDYANAIVPPLRELGLRVLIEPGRFLVGNAGVLLTRVRYIKTAGGRIRGGEQAAQKKFAIVDAGMNDLIRPALYQSYHEIVPVRGGTGAVPSSSGKDDTAVVPPGFEPIDIVGPVCESGDFFAQDREMPPLRDGDLAAIMSAGAYGFVMASTYNSRPMPAEVMVSGDKFALVRERQTYADLIRGEL